MGYKTAADVGVWCALSLLGVVLNHWRGQETPASSVYHPSSLPNHAIFDLVHLQSCMDTAD